MTIVLRQRAGAVVHACELPAPPPDVIERPEGKFWVRAGIADGSATYLDATLVRLEVAE